MGIEQQCFNGQIPWSSYFFNHLTAITFRSLHHQHEYAKISGGYLLGIEISFLVNGSQLNMTRHETSLFCDTNDRLNISVNNWGIQHCNWDYDVVGIKVNAREIFKFYKHNTWAQKLLTHLFFKKINNATHEFYIRRSSKTS